MAHIINSTIDNFGYLRIKSKVCMFYGFGRNLENYGMVHEKLCLVEQKKRIGNLYILSEIDHSLYNVKYFIFHLLCLL